MQPVLGAEKTEKLIETINRLDTGSDIRVLRGLVAI